MGVTNFLIEGVSCSGKSAVCRELQLRGLQAINGDTELAYQGDPLTGTPTDTRTHDNHLWHVGTVERFVADRSAPITFFCGGSRNVQSFVHLFDGVFVLEIDSATLVKRLDQRPEDEWGARPEERALVIRKHATNEDVPDGIGVDATQPLKQVVDQIVRLAKADSM